MSTDSGFGLMTSHRNFSQQVVCEAPASWTFGCEMAHASAGLWPGPSQAPRAQMTSPGFGREQSAEEHDPGSASLSPAASAVEGPSWLRSLSNAFFGWPRGHGSSTHEFLNAGPLHPTQFSSEN